MIWLEIPRWLQTTLLSIATVVVAVTAWIVFFGFLVIYK